MFQKERCYRLRCLGFQPAIVVYSDDFHFSTRLSVIFLKPLRLTKAPPRARTMVIMDHAGITLQPDRKQGLNRFTAFQGPHRITLAHRRVIAPIGVVEFNDLPNPSRVRVNTNRIDDRKRSISMRKLHKNFNAKARNPSIATRKNDDIRFLSEASFPA